MVEKDLCYEVLVRALSAGGQYADVFVEEKNSVSIELKDGKIRTISPGIASGVGLRTIYGHNYVYAYDNRLDRQALDELAGSVAAGVQAGAHGDVKELTATPRESVLKPEVMPDTVSLDAKVDLLLRADAAARDSSSTISQVTAYYADVRQKVLVANSQGVMVQDERVRTRLTVSAVAVEGEKRESGFFGPGKSMGFEFFERLTPEDIAKEAARIALVQLEADFAPKGALPVVINNGFGGVILHEAVGHALEATSVADKASVFCDRLGEKIAAECVTAVDDGTILNEWGSANWDDEGAPTQRTELIKDGVLTHYLVDRLGSIKMDQPLTGSARRESYAYAPTSRMTNTFIVPGTASIDDLISSIDYGVFCRNMGGGSVNPPTTDFNFAVTEGYLIKSGKIDRPVKGAALIGRGSDIIKQIDMVADNLDFGTGMCGSRSGAVPASVGQPAIRVSGLVVGGRA